MELLTKQRSNQSPTTDLIPREDNDGRDEPEIKLVPWYSPTLCRFGIHRSRWVYVTSGNCGQLKVCSSCGKTKERTKHKREWQHVKDRTCEQRRVCRRCREMTRSRDRHVWGRTYAAGHVGGFWFGYDREAHKCTRCGDVEIWDVDPD